MRKVWCVWLALLIGCTGEEQKDGDGDGYFPPEDCNDKNAEIRPNIGEDCDGVDNNCDGQVDEPGAFYAPYWYPDEDGDGFGDPEGAVQDCVQPGGYVAEGGDCDDGASTVNPDIPERCNEIDDDCSGVVDDDASGAGEWYADEDGDGVGTDEDIVTACFAPEGYVEEAGDCDDTDAAVQGQIVWYDDDDGDGWGDPDDTVNACTTPVGRVQQDGDCDDTDAAINPDTVWHADADGDGFGDELTTLTQCDQPDGYTLVGGDCDDQDPGAAGTVDLYVDADGDGYGAGAASPGCEGPGYALNDADCDDSAASVNPLAADTYGDGVDSDCDGDLTCEVLTIQPGDLVVDDALDADFCVSFNAVEGDLVLTSQSWTDLSMLSCLCGVGGGLTVTDNTALTSLAGLELLRGVPGAVTITGNTALTDVSALSGLSGIGGDLTVTGNTALTDAAAHAVFDLISVTGTTDISGNQ